MSLRHPSPRPEIREIEHHAPALDRNPLGDSSRRIITVVLPPSPLRTPGRRFPSVVVLGGSTSDGRSLAGHDPFSPNVAEIATEEMLAGTMPPTILAFPDGFTSLGGGPYVDSPAIGRYARFVADDVVDALDAAFPTIPEARSRGVVGRSSGGCGALRLAMERPDRFSACAAHAPDCTFARSLLPGLAVAFRVLGEFGGDPGRFVEAFWSRTSRPREWFETLGVLAASASYSPRSDGGFDLPFSATTGAVRPEIWELWLAHDPVRRIARHRDELSRLRLLFLDAGRQDEYALDLGVRELAERLTELGIPHELELFDGGHTGTTHRYRVSLPKVARALVP